VENDGAGHSSGTTVVLDRYANGVAPTTSSDFEAANRTLEASPLATDPALGSQVGTGITVVPLVYDFDTAEALQQATLLTSFGGLINPSIPTAAAPGALPLPAWESGLWTGTYTRNSVLAAWGHRANVVVTDGIEHAGFVQQVVELNAG